MCHFSCVHRYCANANPIESGTHWIQSWTYANLDWFKFLRIQTHQQTDWAKLESLYNWMCLDSFWVKSKHDRIRIFGFGIPLERRRDYVLTMFIYIILFTITTSQSHSINDSPCSREQSRIVRRYVELVSVLCSSNVFSHIDIGLSAFHLETFTDLW